MRCILIIKDRINFKNTVIRIQSLYTFACKIDLSYSRYIFVRIKQLISLGLLGLMLIKACVIPLLYLDFEIRRDYIVANLCENRNRPQLNCNGKCYLAKKIAEAKKQEEKQAESDFLAKLLAVSTDMPHLTSPYNNTNELNFTFLKSVKFSFQNQFVAFNHIQDIFHPPLA